MDNNGTLGGFHPTPWECQSHTMNAGSLWVGSFKRIQGNDNKMMCEIMPPEPRRCPTAWTWSS